MLDYLRIRNLALIADATMEFAPGLNVLTGETGAGKTFILKALGFLLGDRLGADLVRHGAGKAVVEAVFQLDGEVVIRRELAAATGRSRLTINDDISSQESIKKLRPRLILHVSQHGQQRLLQPAYQAAQVDAFLPDPTILNERRRLVDGLRKLAERRNGMAERAAGLAERRELLEFQQSAIDKVGPRPGEEADLETRRGQLRAMGEAKGCLDGALNLLSHPDGGVLDGLARLEKELAGVMRALPSYGPDYEAVTEARHALADLEGRLRRQGLGGLDDTGDDEPAANLDLEGVEARLWELSQLKRKLGRSLDEIVHLREEISDNLSFLDACNLDLQRLDKEAAALVGELALVLEGLNAARQQAGEALCRALGEELRTLGFSEHVRVLTDFEPHSPLPDHPNLVELRPRILWQPNPGQAPQPLDKIASGGELSRFLLALTNLQAQGEEAVVFDEVDTGIGGVTLNRVAERIHQLAGQRQVLLITHWPQLAARAGAHFLVEKTQSASETTTTCRSLQADEITAELARMAGGGQQGMALAKELMK